MVKGRTGQRVRLYVRSNYPIAPPPPRHLLPSAAHALPTSHRPLSTTAGVSLAGERGDSAQQPRCRGWLARRRAGACFNARRFVELAGLRRARGLHRVCSGGATRRPQVFGYQEGAAADSSRSSRYPFPSPSLFVSTRSGSRG